jgi:hypothetical protein
MFEEGPRYVRAAQAAEQICDLLAGDYPGGKAVLYGRVLFVVLGAIYEAEGDLAERRRTPSRN